jgi:hypothetical protein
LGFEAVGVGSKEETFTLVGRTHVRCRYDRPLRIEPCLGQVTEDFAKDVPSEESKDVWALLHNAHSGSKCANGTGAFGPEVSRVVTTELFPG